MPECLHCGANLPSGTARCPKCGSAPETKEVETGKIPDLKDFEMGKMPNITEMASGNEFSIHVEQRLLSTKPCPKCSRDALWEDVVFLKGKPSGGQYVLACVIGFFFLVGLFNMGDPAVPFQSKIIGVITFGLLTVFYLFHIFNQYSWICPNCSHRIAIKKWEEVSLRERGKIN